MRTLEIKIYIGNEDEEDQPKVFPLTITNMEQPGHGERQFNQDITRGRSMIKKHMKQVETQIHEGR